MKSIREFEWILCMTIAAGCSVQLAAQADPAQSARSLERDGKTAEAESAWRALAKQYPRNPEPFAHLGLLEARQEHYAEAIDFYKRALALAPSMPGLRLNLGLAYFKQGSYADALTMLSPLQKADPSDQRLNILVGMSYYGLGQFAEASPFLQHASEGDPQNLTLLLTLAHACLLSNQYPCVVDAYHHIVALNAESAEADMLVGEALDAMKDKDGAISEFRAAVKANPKEPNVHFGLGYLLWTQSAYPEAAQEFAAELANDPAHALAQLYLADAQIQMGKMDEARPLLEALVKSEPDNFKAHLDLGIVYAETQHNDEAIREYRNAARLSPDDANVHWRLGRLYRAMGHAEEAKAEFAKTGDLNKAANDRLLKIMSTLPAKKPTPQP
ncbi:MAG: tetratricopeptide repeat protein [Terracidiphilus sp.]|nr:tetratricopeptide repeat protein [Terracidiphilus sp.]